MHLAPCSNLIDAGSVISGMQYGGEKPDLGCFETDLPTGVAHVQYEAQTGNGGSSNAVIAGTVNSRLHTQLFYGELSGFEQFNLAGRKITISSYETQAIDFSHIACGSYIFRSYRRK
jgi:hypothetical protein